MTPTAAEILPGRFVVEIGIRQVWPYVTFADNADDATTAEVRLYIDGAFTVTPATPEMGRGEEDDETLWLLRLAELLHLTVRDVAVEDDNGLTVTFHDEVQLRVSGHGAHWTTRDVWWIGVS